MAVALNNAGITAELVSSKEGLEAEVQQRLVQIINGKKEWERTFDAIEDPLLIIEAGYRVRRANLAVAARSGLPIVQVPGKRCYEVVFGRDAPCPGCPLAEALAGKAASAVLELDGAVFQASHFPIDNGDGEVYAAACTYRDITAARALEARLLEAEKMASVGQLAAGVAHEINNPMAFLSSNLSTLRSYFDDLGSVVRKVRLLAPVADRAADDQLREVVRRLARAVGTELDLDDILTDGVALLDESEGGAKRVTHIVRQLQAFAKEKRSAEEDVRLADSVERAVRTLSPRSPAPRSRWRARPTPGCGSRPSPWTRPSPRSSATPSRPPRARRWTSPWTSRTTWWSSPSRTAAKASPRRCAGASSTRSSPPGASAAGWAWASRPSTPRSAATGAWSRSRTAPAAAPGWCSSSRWRPPARPRHGRWPRPGPTGDPPPAAAPWPRAWPVGYGRLKMASDPRLRALCVEGDPPSLGALPALLDEAGFQVDRVSWEGARHRFAERVPDLVVLQGGGPGEGWESVLDQARALRDGEVFVPVVLLAPRG